MHQLLSPLWQRSVTCVALTQTRHYCNNAARTTTTGSMATAHSAWRWWGRKSGYRAPPLLPIPLLRCKIVERLGAVSMLCMLDEDTVCEPHPAAEELFVLNNKVLLLLVILQILCCWWRCSSGVLHCSAQAVSKSMCCSLCCCYACQELLNAAIALCQLCSLFHVYIDTTTLCTVNYCRTK
jgi:hypothetical protein